MVGGNISVSALAVEKGGGAGGFTVGPEFNGQLDLEAVVNGHSSDSARRCMGKEMMHYRETLVTQIT